MVVFAEIELKQQNNMKKQIKSFLFIPFLVLSSSSFGQFGNVFEAPNNNGIYSVETNGSMVFVGTGGSGIYRSDDNGNIWAPINNGIQPWYYYSLLFFNDSLYAGSFGMVHLSEDNGESWIDLNIDLDLNDNIIDLVRKGPYLYASARAKGIYVYSFDSGIWSTANTGLPLNPTVNELLAVGSDLYAATDAGLYKSEDEAASWTLMDNGLSSDMEVFSIFELDGTFLTGTSDGLFKSTDNGGTWLIADSGIPFGATVVSMVEMGGSLYSGTYNGLYASSDLGDNWTTVNNGSTGFGYIYTLGAEGNYLFVAKGNTLFSNQGNPLSREASDISSPHQIMVYPNPGSDQIYIEKNGVELTEIQIFDAKGRLMKTILQNTSTLQVADLPKGIYVIKLKSNENTLIRKFVKQ
ncbi:T9SS type A sorting domain-containing protein [Cryomorphaceae bacterium 1068]|nr:T9SS type A sorting domain-containing protein [Cryomorphaceae bacterium 1068]